MSPANDVPPRHPKKQIADAVTAALDAGWRFRKGRPRGHVWGFLLCPQHDRDGCRIRVYATPRNADDHAAAIRNDMARCPHEEYPYEWS